MNLPQMIIDFHTHLFSQSVKRARSKYVERDRGFAAMYQNPRARIASAADIIEEMDSVGVDVAVVVGFGWQEQDLCEEENNALLEAAMRYPDRLVPFCTVQPKAGERAVTELYRCADLGIRGVGEIRLDRQDKDFESFQDLEAFLGAIRDLQLPLLLHASEPVGHGYPGKGTATPDFLEMVLRFCDGITVVLAHWGGGLPFYALMPEIEVLLKNVYVDTAASPYLYSPRIMSLVASIIGAHKILFASDFPLLTIKRAIDDLSLGGLHEDQKEMVMGGNAQRLLQLIDPNRPRLRTA